jgi:hypothetical protein
MAQQIIRRIKKALTPDLLRGRWQSQASGRVNGHCYIAAEALYHMLGGKAKGYTPVVLSYKTWPAGLDPGETHWFIVDQHGKVLDPTQEQFDGKIPYGSGKRIGFLTKRPSKRALVIMRRVKGKR